MNAKDINEKLEELKEDIHELLTKKGWKPSDDRNFRYTHKKLPGHQVYVYPEVVKHEVGGIPRVQLDHKKAKSYIRNISESLNEDVTTSHMELVKNGWKKSHVGKGYITYQHPNYSDHAIAVLPTHITHTKYKMDPLSTKIKKLTHGDLGNYLKNEKNFK